MNVSKDFEELFECLNAQEVRYLVVGGYAFAFHAIPRHTKDIDILIEPTPENAHRVLKALENFGFGELGLSTQDFSRPDQIIRLGQEPNCVDLITSIAGVSFAEAWEGRSHGHYGSETVSFLGASELMKNKKAVGRPRDLADVAALRELFGPECAAKEE